MLSYGQNKQWQAYFDSIEKVEDLKEKAIFDSSLYVLNAQDRFIGMAQMKPRSFYPLLVSEDDIFMGNYYTIYSLQKETGDTNWGRDYGHHLSNTFYATDNNLIVRGDNNDVRCLDKQTGKQKWINKQFSGRFKFAIHDNKVIINEFYTIKALDIDNGCSLWHFSTDTIAKPFYFEQFKNSVYWGDENDYFFCLNLNSKDIAWSKALPDYHNFYLLNDKILATWNSNSKILLDANTGEVLESFSGKKHADYIYDVAKKGIIKRNSGDYCLF